MSDLDAKTLATASVDGVEVRPDHSEKTYSLIESAKKELRDWSVQWGAKPIPDSAAIDKALELREQNDEVIRPYQAERRYVDEKNRVRNLMGIGEFCRKLDRILGPAHDGGTRIFINDPPRHPAIDEHMKGLFIKMRGMDAFYFHVYEDGKPELPAGWKKICSVQVPYMSEWGIMNLDDRGCFRSWKYIGWRGQVLLRLILAGAISKEEAHAEFGEPQGNDVDREYLNRLREYERDTKRAN